jgi:hypothetical protein
LKQESPYVRRIYAKDIPNNSNLQFKNIQNSKKKKKERKKERKSEETWMWVEAGIHSDNDPRNKDLNSSVGSSMSLKVQLFLHLQVVHMRQRRVASSLGFVGHIIFY